MMLLDCTLPATRFLQSQAWFTRLPARQQARVADAVFTFGAVKGEVVLEAGHEVEGWYAVLSGLVKLQSESQGRRQGFLGVPGGEWFGEGSVMKSEPRRYEVVALRDCELLCLPRPCFEELRATSLPFCQALNDQLNMRLGQAMAIIETMRLGSPEQRVAMHLGPQLWRGSRKLRLSQEELGILAGLSRQTVNAALKELERRGLVSLEFGRVSILDESGLVAFALAK